MCFDYVYPLFIYLLLHLSPSDFGKIQSDTSPEVLLTFTLSLFNNISRHQTRDFWQVQKHHHILMHVYILHFEI